MKLYCSYLKLFKIRVACNNIYRKILGYGRRDSASNMFLSNGIDTFETRPRLSCHIFIERVNNSQKEIVNCITVGSEIIMLRNIGNPYCISNVYLVVTVASVHLHCIY